MAQALLLPLVLLTASLSSAHAAAAAPAQGHAKLQFGPGRAHVPAVKNVSEKVPEGVGPSRPVIAPHRPGPAQAISVAPGHEKAAAVLTAASARAPVVQAPITQAPVLGGTFTAFSQTPDNIVGVPPDSAIAAGPRQLVVITNGGIKVFNKNGTQVGFMSLSKFFSGATGGGDNIFDPRAFFDPGLSRFWILAASENDSTGPGDTNRSSLLVALSNGDDPSDLKAGWSRFGMDVTVEPNGQPPDTSPKWCDYPMLGVDADSIFISCNMFDFPSAATSSQSAGGFDFAKVRRFGKSQFVNNQCCNYFFFEDLPEGNLSTDASTVQPAREYGATATDGEWMVDAESCTTCSATLTVWHWTVDASGDHLASQGIDVGGFPSPNQARQPGGPNDIDAGDARLLFAFWKNGQLSTGQTIACPNSGDCAAYTEVDVSGGLNTMGLLNDLFVGDDGQDRMYPAVDVNAAGDKTMVYSISGPSTFLSTDSVGILRTANCTGKSPAANCASALNGPETTLAGGNSDYQQFACLPGKPCTSSVNRWGDYSSAAADPDGTGVWVHGEFSQPTDQSVGLPPAIGTWATIVGLTNELQDTTPPVTTATVDPTPVSGWNRSDHVFVTLNATDPDSGVRSITYAVAGAEAIPQTTVINTSFALVTLQNEGLSTVKFQATDNWGNLEAPQFQTVRIDRTSPGVSCFGADSVWHAKDVSTTCFGVDTMSGLADNADANFTLTTSVPAGTETASAFTNTHDVCDVAGNCTTAGPIGPFMVDKKAPDIAITAPSGATTYTLNQVVSASYGCTDGGSGVASCTGPAPSGGNLDTSFVGMHTFTVNAVDDVGNKSAMTVNYFVSYGVCPQYDATKALPAGAYPFRIELCDANNVDVSSSSITVTALVIMPGPITPVSGAQPNNQFTFDPTIGTSGGYVYVLRTSGMLPGSYQLHVSATNDPNDHVLPFVIK